MITSVSNNISFTVGNVNSSPTKSVNLPKVNSLVLIKILDKQGSNYKLLINGSVFKSSLPINIIKGDEVLARVISHQPFRLTLNNLNTTTQNLLSVLNFSDKKEVREFLKEISEKNTPLEKKKLKNFVDFIEKKESGIDHLQLALLAQVYVVVPEYLGNFTEESENIFKYKFEEVVQNIFLSLRKLYNRNETISRIIDPLINVANNGSIQNSLTHYDSRDIQIITLINSVSKINIINFSYLKAEFENLCFWLVIYLFQKSVYNYFRIYPDFLVISNDDELYLFNIYSHKNDRGDFDIRISSNSNNETNTIKGILLTTKIIIELYLNKNKEVQLKDKSEMLTQTLKAEMKLDTYIVKKDSFEEHLYDSKNIDRKFLAIQRVA
jgi:hypothetical protein